MPDPKSEWKQQDLGGDSRNPEKILIFVQDMSRSISPRISLVLMDLSVFVSMINNSTGRIFSLVTLQATLSLTAPKTPFVPPYINNLLIFFLTDCSRVALSANIHSQVYDLSTRTH